MAESILLNMLIYNIPLIGVVITYITKMKLQNRANTHELIMHAISQQNKELLSRKIEAADHLWKCFISIKQYSVAVRTLEFSNLENLAKRSSDPKIQKALDFLSKKPISELYIEIQNLNAESAQPWITTQSWATYLAYFAIVHYAMFQFEQAKFGESGDRFFHMEKLLEMLQSALPNEDLKDTSHSSLVKAIDLLESTLLRELKNIVEQKENPVEIESARNVMKLYSELSNR